MTQSDLRDALRSMVREHGFEQVERHLGELARSEHDTGISERKAKPSPRIAAKQSPKRRPKPTASHYVARMEVSPDKGPSVSELAKRFDAKSFLPTFGDVINFCLSYGVDLPASRSRANALPRVFKLLASLEVNEIRRIIDEGLFSGPSRLGPIADAIRRNGRSVAAANVQDSSDGAS